ncbi:hypothetical protein EJ08DRAFT_400256 [Tothia fuscella]|uniref:Uncharacterized protein n=1 Tax=Tothia fuscella TaxID=1048955 RepID=A0A9P4NL17_9PEZI|nr:hypothetical protein EJ08DRAFT_400256 [Tothia fuscella]
MLPSLKCYRSNIIALRRFIAESSAINNITHLFLYADGNTFTLRFNPLLHFSKLQHLAFHLQTAMLHGQLWAEWKDNFQVCKSSLKSLALVVNTWASEEPLFRPATIATDERMTALWFTPLPVLPLNLDDFESLEELSLDLVMSTQVFGQGDPESLQRPLNLPQSLKVLRFEIGMIYRQQGRTRSMGSQHPIVGRRSSDRRSRVPQHYPPEIVQECAI